MLLITPEFVRRKIVAIDFWVCVFACLALTLELSTSQGSFLFQGELPISATAPMPFLIDKGEQREAEVTVTNNSNEEISVLGIDTGCGCIAASSNTFPLRLLPGANGAIQLLYSQKTFGVAGRRVELETSRLGNIKCQIISIKERDDFVKPTEINSTARRFNLEWTGYLSRMSQKSEYRVTSIDYDKKVLHLDERVDNRSTESSQGYGVIADYDVVRTVLPFRLHDSEMKDIRTVVKISIGDDRSEEKHNYIVPVNIRCTDVPVRVEPNVVALGTILDVERQRSVMQTVRVAPKQNITIEGCEYVLDAECRDFCRINAQFLRAESVIRLELAVDIAKIVVDSSVVRVRGRILVKYSNRGVRGVVVVPIAAAIVRCHDDDGRLVIAPCRGGGAG